MRPEGSRRARLHSSALRGAFSARGRRNVYLLSLEGGQGIRSAYQDNDSYETPLHLACNNGDLEIVKHLVEVSRCCVYDTDKDGVDPFMMALMQDRSNVVGYLAEGHYNVLESVPKLFIQACKLNSVCAVKMLTRFVGGDVDKAVGCDSDHNTPLHVAAERGHFDLICHALSQQLRTQF